LARYYSAACPDQYGAIEYAGLSAKALAERVFLAITCVRWPVRLRWRVGSAENDPGDCFPLTISGLRTTVRSPEPPKNIYLTPAAAIVVTPAPMAIIVTAKAATTVVTVESV
jgi:hypothetical protein